MKFIILYGWTLVDRGSRKQKKRSENDDKLSTERSWLKHFSLKLQRLTDRILLITNMSLRWTWIFEGQKRFSETQKSLVGKLPILSSSFDTVSKVEDKRISES